MGRSSTWRRSPNHSIWSRPSPRTSRKIVAQSRCPMRAKYLGPVSSPAPRLARTANGYSSTFNIRGSPSPSPAPGNKERSGRRLVHRRFGGRRRVEKHGGGDASVLLFFARGNQEAHPACKGRLGIEQHAIEDIAIVVHVVEGQLDAARVGAALRTFERYALQIGRRKSITDGPVPCH